ncbi:MAG: hypothetical protein Q8941_00580 [Bacteroidota bacterium]|nr:hypothetical protein [Bacteroidota bacterium]
MKKIFLSLQVTLLAGIAVAQTYPEPEFSNEVYYLKKDSAYTVVRLEKGHSKMEQKGSAIGGYESGYSLDGAKSSVRFSNGNNLSFVISTGSSSGSSSHKSDSTMQANGMDPSMMQGMSSMFDPTSSISLYKVESSKGERKVILQKSGSALPFANHKPRSSDKYTFSMKKIRQGYWELVIDKPLPKGEYAFTMMNVMGGDAMAGSTLLFAFAID